jgi:hypothetical protein
MERRALVNTKDFGQQEKKIEILSLVYNPVKETMS